MTQGSGSEMLARIAITWRASENRLLAPPLEFLIQQVWGGVRIGVSRKFPGDVAGLQATFGKPLLHGAEAMKFRQCTHPSPVRDCLERADFTPLCVRVPPVRTSKGRRPKTVLLSKKKPKIWGQTDLSLPPGSTTYSLCDLKGLS